MFIFFTASDDDSNSIEALTAPKRDLTKPEEDIEKDEVIVVVASILAPRGEFISSGGNIVVTTITILDNEG